jgi:hypothetical protein
VDGLGELTGGPGQQRSLVMIFQVLSWAFALSPGAELRVRPGGRFRESGLFFPLSGIFAYVLRW